MPFFLPHAKSQSEVGINEPIGRKKRKLLGEKSEGNKKKRKRNVANGTRLNEQMKEFLAVMVENGNQDGLILYAKKGPYSKSTISGNHTQK